MHYQPVELTENDMYLSQGNMNSQPQAVDDPLDDVFGGGDEELHDTRTSHPSEMRRLQTDHGTAGYREGVNIGKQDALQKGFDEGYTTGAAIGLQAGQVIGALEGIAEAVHNDKDMGELLESARDELSVEKLFNGDFWKADGLPSYEINEEMLKTKEGALAHPVIRKWTELLEQQIQRWGIKRDILDATSQDVHGKPAEEATDLSAQAAVENPLDW